MAKIKSFIENNAMGVVFEMLPSDMVEYDRLEDNQYKLFEEYVGNNNEVFCLEGFVLVDSLKGKTTKEIKDMVDGIIESLSEMRFLITKEDEVENE